MGKHPTEIRGYKSLEELAHDIGNLRYDALEQFFGYLSKDLSDQSAGDEKRGRPRLSQELKSASEFIDESKKCIGRAWKISKPYMKDVTDKPKT